ncbi:hypothetical protein OPIT5_23790 [Opitutaceae bacterium TAV5]|nr:hypothetical protein OPIT5_23790 [Opitutaceae bacterium TAV5]
MPGARALPGSTIRRGMCVYCLRGGVDPCTHSEAQPLLLFATQVGKIMQFTGNLKLKFRIMKLALIVLKQKWSGILLQEEKE